MVFRKTIGSDEEFGSLVCAGNGSHKLCEKLGAVGFLFRLLQIVVGIVPDQAADFFGMGLDE